MTMIDTLYDAHYQAVKNGVGICRKIAENQELEAAGVDIQFDGTI